MTGRIEPARARASDTNGQRRCEEGSQRDERAYAPAGMPANGGLLLRALRAAVME